MAASSTIAVSSPPVARMRPLDRAVAIGAATLLLAATIRAGQAVSAQNGLLVMVGALLGVSLYHASFGFTGGWRAFVTEGRSGSLRAQLLLLALASFLLIPPIAFGSLFGRPVHGFVVPLSIPLALGAFMFGIGMQLGGGCGSGTLFTAGGGSVRMLVTLIAFILGSVAGVAQLPAWNALPALPGLALWREIGLLPTLAATGLVLAALAYLAAGTERRRTGKLMPIGRISSTPHLLTGPWPLLWGAIALSVLSLLTLLVAGHPWGITGAFGIWGAKALAALGVDVSSWRAFSDPGARAQLDGSLFLLPVSAMDVGLILGAMLAAALAGKFAPKVDLSAGSLAAAVVGGLLMGYGARLSSGCNIGAMLSGIASGSLHGWIWFALAFAGSLIGIRARRAFGLAG